ncbi:uncharacterized protein [Spinacia oleracea]|uniref:DDE Tnp4 domain-containing protein n=1 Tax=Spinacia oleracea TaxID=3562 RepID=A0ABM3R7T7_SPIOL|nr:uncharacterized protein LOC110779726 [Spinacia oleracea]
MLAYGTAADSVDEYIKIAQSTTRESLVHFVKGVRLAFTEEYLRRPTATDSQRLLHDGERRGFPGMMGKAVASGDLWIWHAFLGTPGTCNDINVLQRSPVFDDIYQGKVPEVNFTVNGNTYTKGYYLNDGIYPKWPVFIPAIRLPMNPVDELFTQRKESVRKVVERAFGVLQSCFAIIQRPTLNTSQHSSPGTLCPTSPQVDPYPTTPRGDWSSTRMPFENQYPTQSLGEDEDEDEDEVQVQNT